MKSDLVFTAWLGIVPPARQFDHGDLLQWEETVADLGFIVASRHCDSGPSEWTVEAWPARRLSHAYMLLLLGILLSIATGLLGLVCLFWGVVVGILGMGPGGAISDPSTRFMLGGLPLLLGLIYLTPVILFRRRSWVVAYGAVTFLAAIIVFAVAMNVALESRNALPTLFLLLAPATALVAYIRVCRRQGDDAGGHS